MTRPSYIKTHPKLVPEAPQNTSNGFCNTLGVWLPHLHLHFRNMSIIHPFMSLDCMKHAFETLQHMFIFHVCLFYEMNSMQHSSATCATHFSETWLDSTMPQTH